MSLRTVALASAAMVGFASNSLLCRAALGAGEIDAAAFTGLRLGSGAIVLALLARGALRRGSVASGALLFTYAAAFSFAYLALPAGTGALLLFGAVQVTMIGAGIVGGERPGPSTWGGAALAIGGLVLLLLPGITAPPPGAAVLMIAAGVAWGGYSLRGRGARDPLAATAGNFVRAVPLAIVLLLASQPLHASPRGAALAVVSGALTSGVIYAVWYAALRGLTATSAALVQLTVPVIAAVGGALLLGETLSARLGIASAMVLGGVALALRRGR